MAKATTEQSTERMLKARVATYSVEELLPLAASRLTTDFANGNVSDVYARLHAIGGNASRALVARMMLTMGAAERGLLALDLARQVDTVPPNKTSTSILRDLALFHLLDEQP